MELLIQKPQFNPDAFKVGRGVWVKDTSHVVNKKIRYESPLREVEADAIISSYSPLEISVDFWGFKEGRMVSVRIPVDMVAEGSITIKHGGSK